jgi:hypothetical protein
MTILSLGFESLINSLQRFVLAETISAFEVTRPLVWLNVCWCLSSIHLSILLFACVRDTGKTGSGPMNGSFEPILARVSASSFPGMPEWPGTQKRTTLLHEPSMLRIFMHSQVSFEWTSKEVNDFIADLLSLHMYMFLPVKFWEMLSWADLIMAKISAWNTLVYVPKLKLREISGSQQ